jgi:hypothetical protein
MWDYTLASVHNSFRRALHVSDEAIMKIEKASPDLLEVLKGEVRRGKPPASLARAET